ncbi:MAG TPA: NUDIX domain-containing protein [Mycobacteriales bacterium]|nr:NUDIX domain-containing protein [Mycobacteriales bacterium]
MDQPEVVYRQAARVVVVDANGRTLLMQGCDPVTPHVRFWFTPGGGADEGESLAAAGARELYEETGLVVLPADLGEPVLRYTSEFPFDGRHYLQEQDVFLLRTSAFDAVPVALDVHEIRSDVRLAWISLDELAALEEPYYPPELPDLVRLAMSRS